jgi:hypothetical protein
MKSSTKIRAARIIDIPGAKKGDILTVTVYPDSATSLHNAHKITQIQNNENIKLSIS